jgi:hypothetical protein
MIEIKILGHDAEIDPFRCPMIVYIANCDRVVN